MVVVLQRRFVYLLVFLQRRILILARTFSSFGKEFTVVSPERVYEHNAKKWTEKNTVYLCLLKCIAFPNGQTGTTVILLQ